MFNKRGPSAHAYVKSMTSSRVPLIMTASHTPGDSAGFEKQELHTNNT